MLVDGGKPSDGDFVVDFIRELGYARIDHVVMTHTHDDHIGGLINVLDNFEAGELWMSVYNENTPLLLDFITKVEEIGPSIKWVARDDAYEIDDVNVTILNPPKGSTLNRLGGPNGASIVIRFEYEATSILLAADIDSSRDRELVNIYGDHLRGTVLKCAHHGSEISNSQQFLTAVKPLIAIVSTGPSQYNYPSKITMARIEKMVPDVYRTDKDGTVIVIMDGENVSIKTR
ncbi:hypothetical protein AMJ86_10275 [bacterium SM23_57]|nr:MAG: hypothetical protein AMJ86_10275 [bacterium SM23_57]